VAGSGKTTLAARIGAALDVPHVEIDGLFHGPGWTQRPEFMDDVEEFTRHDAWVTEWQYGPARPVVLARADLVVWLDLPTPQVMWQVSSRTLRRRLHRVELWNGNVEGPLRTFFTDPEHIVRWAWSTRHKFRDLDRRVAADRPDLPVVRLTSHREARRWLARVALADPR
jgi:adenylate kinase family enzyme